MKKLLALFSSFSLITHLQAMDAPKPRESEEKLFAALRIADVQKTELIHSMEKGNPEALHALLERSSPTPRELNAMADQIIQLAPPNKRIALLSVLLKHGAESKQLVYLREKAILKNDIELANWITALCMPCPKGEILMAAQQKRSLSRSK